MASGGVAKKIFLFEGPRLPSDNRLKRRHAIKRRRKKSSNGDDESINSAVSSASLLSIPHSLSNHCSLNSDFEDESQYFEDDGTPRRNHLFETSEISEENAVKVKEENVRNANEFYSEISDHKYECYLGELGSDFSEVVIDSSSSCSECEEEEPFYEEVGEARVSSGSYVSPSSSGPPDADKKGSDETNSSRPPTPPPYESLYSEPIYGTASLGGEATLAWDPNSPIYNDCSVSSFDSSPSQSLPPSASSFYYRRDSPLPEIPTSQNLKFSTLAKSTTRKIAKQFAKMRKFSKGSLGEEELYSQLSHPSLSLPASLPPPPPVPPGLTSLTGNSNGSCHQYKRSISRPIIPPPEPPKTFQPTTPNRDDNEDSDFYDSGSDYSELIRNFVSQVQPIYSMEEEPLYQYYNYGLSHEPESDYQPVIPKNLGLTLDMLVPRVGQRTLWCDLPEVKASGILTILSDKQKQFQEAIFEILTSEVSYIKSLDVLISLFYDGLAHLLKPEEMTLVFGNIKEVKSVAEGFLADLLAKWKESWYIQEIGEIVNEATRSKFSVFKGYCQNKPYQDKILQKLRNNNEEFCQTVKRIEEDKRCQMLRMDSFLLLPMQRITRLPLLVNAVIQRSQSAKEKTICEEALENLTKLVLACNDAARESQDAEETASIFDKLEFPRGRALASLGQFLMKSEFMKNPFDKPQWTLRKNKRTFYWILLFADQLLVTKKKSNGKYQVLESVSPLISHVKPLPNLEGVSDFQHYFMLHFNKREAIYFLAAKSEAEVERWKERLDGLRENRKVLIVESLFPFQGSREDELSFHVGDKIEVIQIKPDGWYFGTKVSNSEESGWFPGNYCCEC